MYTFNDIKIALKEVFPTEFALSEVVFDTKTNRTFVEIMQVDPYSIIYANGIERILKKAFTNVKFKYGECSVIQGRKVNFLFKEIVGHQQEKHSEPKGTFDLLTEIIKKVDHKMAELRKIMPDITSADKLYLIALELSIETPYSISNILSLIHDKYAYDESDFSEVKSVEDLKKILFKKPLCYRIRACGKMEKEEFLKTFKDSTCSMLCAKDKILLSTVPEPPFVPKQNFDLLEWSKKFQKGIIKDMSRELETVKEYVFSSKDMPELMKKCKGYNHTKINEIPELKSGMLVEAKSVDGLYLATCEEYFGVPAVRLTSVENAFNHSYVPIEDIIAIYKYDETRDMRHYYPDQKTKDGVNISYVEIWRKPEPKSMTLAEIEKELGYPVEINQWIDLREKLPPFATDVLIYNSDHLEGPRENSSVFRAWYETGGNFHDRDGWEYKNVTHWMPLPEPPK